MESNDVEHTDEHCICEMCWEIGDEQAFLRVEALGFPKKIDLENKNFCGLGERFTELAEDLLLFLKNKFGEKIPFVMGLALRMSCYAEYRINGAIEPSIWADRYSPHKEDKVSQRFRLGTPIDEPVIENDLLIFLGVFMLSIAANFQANGNTQRAYDAIFQANFLISLSSVYEIIELQVAAIESGKKESLSAAGLQGAISRNKPYKDLKNWALEKATNMRGAHRDISRELAGQLPTHLADASKDPERLIYDALRTSKS